MDATVYKPSEWGAKFHALDHDEALGAGSAGVGKSVVLRAEPIKQLVIEHQRCLLPKGHPQRINWGESRGWALYLRRSFPMLQQAIMEAKRLYRAIDPSCEWSEKDKWLRFKSGYTFQFAHCYDRNDWEQFYSNEYTCICFDELIQFLKDQYENIASRCRTSDPILRKMLKVRAMSNPVFNSDGGEQFEVDDPYWVRAYFVDPAPAGGVTLINRKKRMDGRTVDIKRIYLPGRLYDNPDKEFVETYEAKLLNMSEAKQQALLHGNWYYLSGNYFTDVWDTSIHSVAPFAIPDGWKRFRSMDWGFKSKGAVIWWALDNDGNLFAEREYTFQLAHPTKVAREVKRIETLFGLATERSSLLTGPADTQIWEDKMGEVTIAEYFEREGVSWAKANKKSRRNNAREMHTRLKDHGNGTRTPGLVIFGALCPNLMRTIPMLPPGPAWDPEEPGELKDDHWLDAAFYACAFASRGGGVTGGKAKRKKDEFDEPDNRRAKRRRTGPYYGYGN